jgi:hypothetical protein
MLQDVSLKMIYGWDGILYEYTAQCVHGYVSVNMTTLRYLLAVTLDLLSPTLVTGTGDSPPFWRWSAEPIARPHAIVLWRVDADRPRDIYRRQFQPRRGRLTAIVVLHCATEAPSKLAILQRRRRRPLSACPPAHQLLGSYCSLGRSP